MPNVMPMHKIGSRWQMRCGKTLEKTVQPEAEKELFDPGDGFSQIIVHGVVEPVHGQSDEQAFIEVDQQVFVFV